MTASSFPLCRGPRIQEFRGAHKVVGDDSEPDPVRGAGGVTIATPSKTMSPFEHIGPTFALDAPALSATEPTLSFMRTPCWWSPSCFARLRSSLRRCVEATRLRERPVRCQRLSRGGSVSRSRPLEQAVQVPEKHHGVRLRGGLLACHPDLQITQTSLVA